MALKPRSFQQGALEEFSEGQCKIYYDRASATNEFLKFQKAKKISKNVNPTNNLLLHHLRDLLNDWPQGHAPLENLRPRI